MTKILLFLSITSVVAGIVPAMITGQWSPIVIFLLALGVICFLLGIAIKIKHHSYFWQQRTTEAIVNSSIATISLLIILGSINFFVIRNPLRIDLTENQIFTLSPQSQAIAGNLKQTLKVWVFDRNIDPETQTLLQNYQRYSRNNFRYQLIDPNIEIGLARQFNVESIGDVFLEYGERRQKLETTITPLGTNITEARLTNGIIKIRQGNTSYLYFLQGHGEATWDDLEGEYSQAIMESIDRGYVVRPLNLATNPQIPRNADLIAIAKPLRKLLDREVTSIEQYLQRGGNLLLMLMPNIDIGIDSILQDWGIELDNRLIIDGSAIEEQPPTIVIVDRYGNHPITENFGNGISLFSQSRRIGIKEKANIKATPLVITNETTWAESNLASEEITFDDREDIAGPLNIAIAFTGENNSRLAVFGNAIFATNGWFTQQLNGDIFLNTVDWLVGTNNDILSIRPKELTNRRLNLSPLQATIISWLAIRIAPILSLLVATIIWWHQR